MLVAGVQSSLANELVVLSCSTSEDGEIEVRISLAAAQRRSELGSNRVDDTALVALDGESREQHTHIHNLEVKCDDSGMAVNLEFNAPFSGVVYSKGHFDNPKCRYVKGGSNRNSYTFLIPLDDCGTTSSCRLCNSVDNIIVIQTDDTVQEIWDAARKISCASTGNKKRVHFRPFVVDMLEVVSVPVPNGLIDCWMDIQRGKYPNTSPIEEIIKIGETLTVLVYIKDEQRQHDIRVRDCWAYDGEDYDSPDTHKLQLTDNQGCPIKKKLITTWQRTQQTGKSGASLIAYTSLSAFKFPDKMQVYLTCNIEWSEFLATNPVVPGSITGTSRFFCEAVGLKRGFKLSLICFGECEGRCGGEPSIPISTVVPPTPVTRPTPPPRPVCYPGSKNPACPQTTTYLPPVTTTEPPLRCYPGNPEPRCPKPVTQPPLRYVHKLLPSLHLDAIQETQILDVPKQLPNLHLDATLEIRTQDVPKPLPNLHLNVTQEIQTLDAPKRPPNLHFAATQEIQILDVLKLLPSLHLDATQEVRIQDVPKLLPNPHLDVTQEIRIQDVPKLLPCLHLDVTQGIQIQDVPKQLPSLHLDVTQEIRILDVPKPPLSLHLNVIQEILILDVQNQLPNLHLDVIQETRIQDVPKLQHFPLPTYLQLQQKLR
uniref:(California timema) hypothetical protein n=1 Tax=Timema californicum TaxID=61474 RepID=A0A7R9P4I8_TIMCA|nr:unnamed protein product [Timema californicum]